MAPQSAVAPEAAKIRDHSRRIETLDGLRAIAILLVIFDHYIPRVVSPGGGIRPMLLEAAGWAGYGVDLFFVLSGFLITGILVDARGSANYFRRFYWRRSLRIFPAFYGLLISAVVVIPNLFRRVGFWWFALYLRNWIGQDRNSDMALGHLWSLAVEEQFYIAWSVVVFLCPPRYLIRVIVVLIGAAPLVRALLHHLGYPPYLLFHITPARMDSLLFGALVAVAVRSGWAFYGKRAAMAGVAIGILGLVIPRVYLGASIYDLEYQMATPFLMGVLFASVVFLCVYLSERTLAYKALTCSASITIAKYSYAIYLWHLVAAGIVTVGLAIPNAHRSASFRWYAPVFIILSCSLSFAFAALSWRYIEAPVLSLKDRYFPSVTQSAQGIRNS